MSYQEINLGTIANDGTGDDARAGGSKINSQFKELYSRMFLLNGFMTTRYSYDPNALSFNAHKVADIIEGWQDVAQTKWIRGRILTLPLDAEDPASVEVLFGGAANREKRVTYGSVTGTYNINLSLATVFVLTLTGNTVLTFSNLPTADTVAMKQIIASGNFTLGFPAYVNFDPDSELYDGTVRNRISLDIINGTTSSEVVDAYIKNL